MPNRTTTKTKVSTQTRVVIAVGILLLLGLGAYGFGFAPTFKAQKPLKVISPKPPAPSLSRLFEVSLANDTPSGTTSGASEQTIAKFVLLNANTSNISFTLKTMSFAVTSTTRTAEPTSIKVYKSAVDVSNLLYEGLFPPTQFDTLINEFSPRDNQFTDASLPPGETPLIITMDTSEATTNDSLFLEFKNATWRNGVTEDNKILNVGIKTPQLNY